MKKYKHMKEVTFVDGVGKTSFVDGVGKNTRFMVDGKKVKAERTYKGKETMPRPTMNYVPCPAPMTREQFEEDGKQLEKTNKVTGLWYPHKAKC